MTTPEQPAHGIPEDEITVPVPAATVILVRDGQPGLEVLVLRKASGNHFAGGAWVFPGGKAEDADLAFTGQTNAMENDYAGLKVAAVREMFEECRILLARAPGDENILDAALRESLLTAGADKPMLEIAGAAGLQLATDQLERFAHWITPPSRAKRFDTHFFVAPAPAGQAEVTVDGYEIVDANWCRPADMLEEVHAGRLKLVLPTMMNLIKLSQWEDVDALITHTRREEVFCVRPKRVETPEGQQIIIPAEAGYGVTTIPSQFLRSA